MYKQQIPREQMPSRKINLKEILKYKLKKHPMKNLPRECHLKWKNKFTMMQPKTRQQRARRSMQSLAGILVEAHHIRY